VKNHLHTHYAVFWQHAANDLVNLTISKNIPQNLVTLGHWKKKKKPQAQNST